MYPAYDYCPSTKCMYCYPQRASATNKRHLRKTEFNEWAMNGQNATSVQCFLEPTSDALLLTNSCIWFDEAVVDVTLDPLVTH